MPALSLVSKRLLYSGLQRTSSATAIVFAGFAVVFGMSLQPDDGVGAGGDGLEVLLQGIVIGGFHQFAGDTASADFRGDDGVADIQFAVFDDVGGIGSIAIDIGLKHVVLSVVYDFHG